MQSEQPTTQYRATLLPALHRLQDRHGYLRAEDLKELAKSAQVPLHRIHEVASFFPHFRLSQPAATVVRVCRDLSCHLAGAAKLHDELSHLDDGERVVVEGVSCLGRCDRCPAVCVSTHVTPEAEAGGNGAAAAGQESEWKVRELYYLGRTAEQLNQVIARCAAGKPPPPDLDAPEHSAGTHLEAPAGWMIDPYPKQDESAAYGAVREAVRQRDESLARAATILHDQRKWTRGRCERFRRAAQARLEVDFPVDAEMRDAVRAWQTEGDWAAGPELGGWADALFAELKAADLRGLGGAGVPAEQKWRDLRDGVRTARRRGEDDRAFIIVNGDESEPATFKDRELLLRVPHIIVEAVILAGLLTEATQGFIYIRHEYHEQIEACRKAIEAAEEEGLCGAKPWVLGRPFPISVFVSPGGYICGEQSALIEAMSDRRGEPRNLPPKLETNGLDNQPTLVSNVETFAWTPFIFRNESAQYAALGVNGCKGRRFFSVSGDVNRPGVYEVPMGLTVRELIFDEQYCRGMKDGTKFKALAPSGPSGGFIPAKIPISSRTRQNATWIELSQRRGVDAETVADLDALDLELELNVFRALSPTQALGAGLVVYGEKRNMAKHAVNAMEFFRNESCGKCVPCRLGSQKLAALGGNLLRGRVNPSQWAELLPVIQDLRETMELTSICGLGRAAPTPMRTVMEFFPGDIDKCMHPATSAKPQAAKAMKHTVPTAASAGEVRR